MRVKVRNNNIESALRVFKKRSSETIKQLKRENCDDKLKTQHQQGNTNDTTTRN